MAAPVPEAPIQIEQAEVKVEQLPMEKVLVEQIPIKEESVIEGAPQIEDKPVIQENNPVLQVPFQAPVENIKLEIKEKEEPIIQGRVQGGTKTTRRLHRKMSKKSRKYAISKKYKRRRS